MGQYRAATGSFDRQFHMRGSAEIRCPCGEDSLKSLQDAQCFSLVSPSVLILSISVPLLVSSFVWDVVSVRVR